MSNADVFLSHFHEIEKWVRKELDVDENRSFTDMIRELRKYPLVNRFYDDLHQYASLRNAIVHTRKGGIPIAEPYEETVMQIERIKNELFNPKKIATSPNIFTIKKETPLEDFLYQVAEKDYSQAPVVNDEFQIIEIITTNSVARWLAANIKNDLISIKDTTIGDILQHVEYKSNFKFISKFKTYYEAAAKFQDYALNKGHNPDAIFVTDRGTSNEKLIGILCIEDLAPFFIKQ